MRFDLDDSDVIFRDIQGPYIILDVMESVIDHVAGPFAPSVENTLVIRVNVCHIARSVMVLLSVGIQEPVQRICLGSWDCLQSRQ